MKKIYKRLLVLVIILLILGAGAFLVLRGISNARTAYIENTERYTIAKGDLSLNAVGSGKVVSSDSKKVSSKGTISELKVSVGDIVKQGDLLATYTDALGKAVEFKSDYDGVITAVPSSAALNYFEISNSAALQVVIQITEKDVNRISIDQNALITIDAIGTEIIGKVSRVSQVGVTNGDYSVYSVTVTFDKGDKPILLGMTASAKITTQTKTGVYKVPVDAVIESGKGRYLLSTEWLGNLNKPQSDYYIEVATGISDSEYVEVSGNDLEGKEVIVLTSSTAGGLSFFRNLRS